MQGAEDRESWRCFRAMVLSCGSFPVQGLDPGSLIALCSSLVVPWARCLR